MKKLSLILFIVLLAGCGGNLDKSAALNWWDENEAIALEILELLKSAPVIERVEIDTRKELITNYKNFDDEAWAVYRSIEKLMKNNKLEVVTIHYLNELIIFGLIVDRYGLSIAGCSLSIIYYSDDLRYKNRENRVVYSEKLKPNWYLEINGDKECIRHAK